MTAIPQSALAQQLLDSLAPLAAAGRDERVSGISEIGAQLVLYCALQRERMVELRAEKPLIGVVLSGEKQIWIGDVCHRLTPGRAFVFPADFDMTVINIPDARSGRYESLILEVADPPPQLLRPRVAATSSAVELTIRLNQEIVAALAHAAALRANADQSARLGAHRLTEVLMLIAGQPAADWLFCASVTRVARGVVLADPARPWTADLLGEKMGMAGSTLRRRLEAEGASLRGVLRETRMAVAQQLLASGAANVGQAAEAAGYASRSHFARAFREAYGMEPRAARRA